MSESRIPLPTEVADMLQEGCRKCWYARNLLQGVLKFHNDSTNGETTGVTTYKPEAIQAAAEEAKRINSSCTGWQGEESPQESLINAEDPALAMSTSLEKNCSHPLS